MSHNLENKNKTVIETKGTHNHECDTGECKAKVVNQIKRRTQHSTPTVATANEISQTSDDYALQLAMPKRQPIASSLSKTTKRDVSPNTCPN